MKSETQPRGRPSAEVVEREKAKFEQVRTEVEQARTRLGQRDVDHLALLDAVVEAIGDMPGRGDEQGAALRGLSDELRRYRDDVDRRLTLRWQQVGLDAFLRSTLAWLAHPTPGRVAMLQGTVERLSGLDAVDEELAEAIGLVGLTIWGTDGD